jgi:hypothetical protein
MELVVAGSDTIPFRDALQAALKSTKNKSGLFKIRVREDGADQFRDETFDDVLIDLATGGGIKRYSMAKDTIPTVSFDRTPEINNLYYALPEGADMDWAKQLLTGVTPILEDLLFEVPVT